MRCLSISTVFFLALASSCPTIFAMPASLVLRSDETSSVKDTDQTIDIQPGKLTNFQVTTKTEINGTLYIDPTEQSRSVGMEVRANFKYGERLAKKQGLIKAIRHYDQATSNVKLTTGSTIARLSEQNRYLILERRVNPVEDKRLRFQSPQPTLTEAEINLIHAPFNSMLVSDWLAKKDVEKGDTWTTDDAMLADILTWDYVENNDIEAKLIDINAGTAKIHLSGTAKGVIDSASTEATIKGTCVFDRQMGHVTGVRIKISENREAGIVAPGFEADIWMDMEIVAAQQTKLTNAALGQLKMSPYSKADQLLLKTACGPYQLLHPRHWRVISNRNERTVMRCIRDGVVLGQCDIIPLTPQPAGASVSLQQFRANVEKTLADSNGQVVNTSQSPSISKNKWMRIDAVGKAEDVDMRWIYYTVTAPDLRRVQLLFSLEQNAMDEFNGYEKELIDAITFEATQQTKAKTPAKQTSTRTTGSGRNGR